MLIVHTIHELFTISEGQRTVAILLCSSYYTFWSGVADSQGRRPKGVQAPEGEAL